MSSKNAHRITKRNTASCGAVDDEVERCVHCRGGDETTRSALAFRGLQVILLCTLQPLIFLAHLCLWSNNNNCGRFCLFSSLMTEKVDLNVGRFDILIFALIEQTIRIHPLILIFRCNLNTLSNLDNANTYTNRFQST